MPFRRIVPFGASTLALSAVVSLTVLSTRYKPQTESVRRQSAIAL
jgi:hypothetical protein